MQIGRQSFYKAASQPNDGCFLVNCRDDFPSLPAGLNEQITLAISHWERAVTETIEAAVAAGEIRPHVPAARLARILITLGNGMILAARNPATRGSPRGLLTDTYRHLAPPVG